MKIKYIIYIFFNIIFSVSLLTGAEQTGDLLIDVDFARFRASDDWVFLEIYLSFPRAKLNHIPVDQYFEASFDVEVDLVYQDSIVARRRWKRRDQSESLEKITNSQQIYDIISFYAQPGNYQIETKIIDLSGNILGTKRIDAPIVSFSRSDLAVSDIELAVQINRDTSKTIYNKNGYTVIPNANAVYGIELPLLYYYCEIYNLSPFTETHPNYTTKVSIQNKYGRIVSELPQRTYERVASSLVDVGEVNVVMLNTGLYTLILHIIDDATADTVQVKKNFYVYRHTDFDKKTASDGNIIRIKSSEFALMSEEELDEYFDQLRYTATVQDKKIYQQLDIEGKKTFLEEFWKKRDPNPETAENEYRTEYLNRVQYVNKRFQISTKAGYRTDRGRVMIMYGEPNQIERHPNTMDEKAYEIWNYDEMEGGIIFVFIDMNGFGDYRLVHSGAEKEITNEDWEDLLQ